MSKNNSFALYHFNSDKKSIGYNAKKAIIARKVSGKIKRILNKLHKDILKLESLKKCHYKSLIKDASDKIQSLEKYRIGIGDTETDYRIIEYLKDKLLETLDKKEIRKLIDDFYEMIHF